MRLTTAEEMNGLSSSSESALINELLQKSFENILESAKLGAFECRLDIEDKFTHGDVLKNYLSDLRGLGYVGIPEKENDVPFVLINWSKPGMTYGFDKRIKL